jgi:hypothetical protein
MEAQGSAGHVGKPEEIVVFIDKVQFKVAEGSLTGAQLRALPSPPIGADRDLYEEVPGGEDLLIDGGTSVTLKEGMHFFTTPHSITPGR